MARYTTLGGPDPVDIHVGKRLRALRQGRKVSQTSLGQANGISFQQIQKYEIGTNRISASMLYGFARTLGVPLTAFFEGLPDTAAPEGSSTPAGADADSGDLTSDQTALPRR
jgi:transcriptional regulator with XRE-family HTH domain